MRDPKVERMLAAEGVRDPEFVSNYDIGKIKPITTQDLAQIRIKGTDKEKVDRFAVKMKEQEGGQRSFPAIVITADGRLITGCHRYLAALKGGYGGIDVYICNNLDTDAVHELRIRGNAIEGDRECREDLLQHASSLVNGGGRTHAQAAEAVGLPADAVSVHLRRERTKFALMEVGASVGLLERIKPTVLDAIATIRRPALEAEVCRVTDRYNLGRDEVRPLVRAVADARSDKDAMAAIQEFEDQVSPATGGGTKRKPKTPTAVIEGAITRLENALRRADLGSLTEEDLFKLQLRLVDFAGDLKKFAEEL